jgi:hypothetical protein
MKIPNVIFAVVPVTGKEQLMYRVCVMDDRPQTDGRTAMARASDDLPSKETARHIANMMSTAIKNVGFDSRVEG